MYPQGGGGRGGGSWRGGPNVHVNGVGPPTPPPAPSVGSTPPAHIKRPEGGARPRKEDLHRSPRTDEEEGEEEEEQTQPPQQQAANGHAGPQGQPQPQPTPVPAPQQPPSKVVLGGGLVNGTGQNHCYLNVVVQSLWSLRAFRDRICRGGTTEGSSNLEQALRSVMDGLVNQEGQQGKAGPVSPRAGAGVSVDGLRQVLSELVVASSSSSSGESGHKKFRAGHMNDAVEAFEEILGLLAVGGGEGQRAVHDTFSLHLREVMLCPGCGCPSPSPARDYDTNVFYVPVRSLMDEAARRAPGGLPPSSMAAAMAMDFGALLQGAGSGDLYSCRNVERCGVARRGEMHAGHRYLVQRPPSVFSLGLVWDSLKSDSGEIQTMLRLIAPVLRLGHFKLPMQPGQPQPPAQGETVGVLRGFFAFHPQKHHYVAFLYYPSVPGWVCLDDGAVLVVGPTHTEALRQCAEQHYRPSLLFYETQPQK